MVTILKKKDSIEKLKKILENVLSKKRKGVDASKFSGILKIDEDAVEVQKKMRDEWN